jgi:Tol biopolymer transport system component
VSLRTLDRLLLVAITILPAVASPSHRSSSASAATASMDVTVDQGTSMAIALSPDRQTLAIDLQGSLWLLPAAGGAANRISDQFSDIRQPTWSPDGQTIAFQAYRDGGWHIWAIGRDGSKLRALTAGPFDDREPHYSHDGRRLAFASDRSGNYDVWVQHLDTGALTQITTNPANDFGPAWSPNDGEIAFASDREGAGVYGITSDGKERLIAKTQGRANAPSWSPDGSHISYNLSTPDRSSVAIDGRDITSDEDVFPFRAEWVSADAFLYTADGLIKRRSLTGSAAEAITFTATLTLERPAYKRKQRDFDSDKPRLARGIVAPAVSPDGRRVACAALGDIWIVPVDGKPMRVTNDRFLDTHPAWSPDGKRLAFSSDRSGNMDLWIRDLDAGTDRRLTDRPTSDMTPAWSPDGKRIAFVGIDGLFTGDIQVVTVQTGEIQEVSSRVFGASPPTWSPDGKRLMFARLKRYSSRFREGVNEFVSIEIDGRDEQAFLPAPHQGSDVRAGGGPVWSPDGKQIAFVMDGALIAMPVDFTGKPTGAPRRLADEIAHSPSWTGNSRFVAYLSNERLRLVPADGGTAKDLPVNLEWTPHIPRGDLVVHVGRFVDVRSGTTRGATDIVVKGNRIA